METEELFGWVVDISGKAAKQKKKLPKTIQKILELLLKDLAELGPQVDWPHYGKLSNKACDLRHCHLTKNKPIYVAVWEVEEASASILLRAVGTHENMKYSEIE